MKRMLVIFLGVSLALAPFTASVNAQSSTSQRPPVEQPLVREGDFAIELATALNLTKAHDEAAAESSLAAINIAPRNGWISDYPMTPDIIAEVRASSARSAAAGSLNMSEADAGSTVDRIGVAMNLPVKVAGEGYAYESGSSSEYSSGSAGAPPEASEYMEPSEVEQYYDDYGPPIVSYYPPPWEYGYLYDWVPWSFWWGGWGFGGFFVLNDFDRPLFFHHGRHHHGGKFVSNHIRDPVNNGFVRVDPAMRSVTPTFAGIGAPTRFAQGATTAINSVGRSHGSNTPELNTFSRFHGYTPGYSAPARAFTTHINPSPSNRFGNFRSYSPNARSFTPHGGFSAPSFHSGFRAAPSFHGGFSGGRGRR